MASKKDLKATVAPHQERAFEWGVWAGRLPEPPEGMSLVGWKHNCGGLNEFDGTNYGSIMCAACRFEVVSPRLEGVTPLYAWRTMDGTLAADPSRQCVEELRCGLSWPSEHNPHPGLKHECWLSKGHEGAHQCKHVVGRRLCEHVYDSTSKTIDHVAEPRSCGATWLPKPDMLADRNHPGIAHVCSLPLDHDGRHRCDRPVGGVPCSINFF